MIGDVINLREEHLNTGEAIFNIIKQKLKGNEKFAIGICGESGSGKSVTAFSLQKVMEMHGIQSRVLQMDDYFKLPPKSNHDNRKKSLEHVGTHEVQLNLIHENVLEFKARKSFLRKPLVNYQENSISEEMINVDEVQVLIIEGTYILEMDDFDISIFIDKNYRDTYESRMNRNRDEQTDFIEEVLKIEHEIIRKFKEKASVILDKDYQIVMP